MEDLLDLPETVAALLEGASPSHRRPSRAGALAAHPPSGGARAAAALCASGVLHPSLAKELSAVDTMFRRWQEEAAAKPRAAAAAQGFEDDVSFSLALVVMNKRGEVRRGMRVAQGWYFVPRQASQHTGELPCSRCCTHIRRRATYFVDRAAPSWRQADEVCRSCMLCVMRSLLGQDDAAILAEAQGILESVWRPTINAALADWLGGGQRLVLAEL